MLNKVASRTRLSNVMLLVVIAALAVALVIQHLRATRIEAELRTELAALSSRLYYTHTLKYYRGAVNWLRDTARTKNAQ